LGRRYDCLRRNRSAGEPVDPGPSRPTEEIVPMTVSIALQPLIALIAGILILIVPRLLSFIVAIYLIFIGVTGLWPELLHGHFPGIQ
jgi:hypothetical protein